MAYFTVRTGCLRRLPKKGVKNLPEEIDWEEKIVYGDDAETRKNFGTCIRGLDRNDSVERTIIGYIFGKH